MSLGLGLGLGVSARVLAGAAGAFSPAEVAGLTQWWDAQSAGTISIGSGVASWANRAAGGVSANQVVGSQQPAYQAAGLNGLPAVVTDGVDDYLTSSSVVGAAARTAFMVADAVVDWGGFASQLLAHYGSGINNIRFRVNDNIGKAPTVLGSSGQVTGGTATPTSPFLVSFGTDGVTGHVGLNGTLTPTTAAMTAGTGSRPFFIGQLPGVGGAPATAFGEILFFDVSLSVGDRQKIEGYLAHRWGLAASLPAGHPYKVAPP